MKVFFRSLFLVAIFTIVKKANADAIVLDWDRSISPHVSGYAVYFGTTAGNYPFRVSVGNATSVTISNLAAGATYYFVATAYNSIGVQSAYSAPLEVVIPAVTSGASAVSAPAAPGAFTQPGSPPIRLPVGSPINGQINHRRFADTRSATDLAGAVHDLMATELPDKRAAAVADFASSANAEAVAASVSQKAIASTDLKPAVQIARPEPEPVLLAMIQSAADPSLSLVQFPVTQGHWYEVQATTDLQSWDSIWQSSVAEADGVIQFADQDAKSYTARFYRVVSH
jgi:hypothetical protein